jgi:hypothetical protein
MLHPLPSASKVLIVVRACPLAAWGILLDLFSAGDFRLFPLGVVLPRRRQVNLLPSSRRTCHIHRMNRLECPRIFSTDLDGLGVGKG